MPVYALGDLSLGRAERLRARSLTVRKRNFDVCVQLYWHAELEPKSYHTARRTAGLIIVELRWEQGWHNRRIYLAAPALTYLHLTASQGLKGSV